jgi:hypothetical protein
MSFINGGDDGAIVTIDEVDGDSLALRRPASVDARCFEPPVGQLQLFLKAWQRKARCWLSLSQRCSGSSETVAPVRAAGLTASDSVGYLVKLL